MPLRVVDELCGGVESHGLTVQQTAVEGCWVVTFDPG